MNCARPDVCLLCRHPATSTLVAHSCNCNWKGRRRPHAYGFSPPKMGAAENRTRVTPAGASLQHQKLLSACGKPSPVSGALAQRTFISVTTGAPPPPPTHKGPGSRRNDEGNHAQLCLLCET